MVIIIYMTLCRMAKTTVLFVFASMWLDIFHKSSLSVGPAWAVEAMTCGSSFDLCISPLVSSASKNVINPSKLMKELELSYSCQSSLPEALRP